MEPVNHDFFEITTSVAPNQRWSERLRRELEVPDPRAECQGELVLGKESRPFQVLAFITRAPGGERRVTGCCGASSAPPPATAGAPGSPRSSC